MQNDDVFGAVLEERAVQLKMTHDRLLILRDTLTGNVAQVLSSMIDAVSAQMKKTKRDRELIKEKEPLCVAKTQEARVAIRQLREQMELLFDELERDVRWNQRWMWIAKTDIQKGFMALTKSIESPNSF